VSSLDQVAHPSIAETCFLRFAELAKKDQQIEALQAQVAGMLSSVVRDALAFAATVAASLSAIAVDPGGYVLVPEGMRDEMTRS
jgi:hypothetical protein